ncbi:hypothetical protein ACIQVE_24435 [Pseudomonas sp. NPDC098747]|uniref:hypothetical protein n=1 Tax=Pseudomonas sp. NPDC098747 TaxID=3364487 RepID=UPI00383BED93
MTGDDQLDDAPPVDLACDADEFWQQVQTTPYPNSREYRHALFNPGANRWRFAATDIDIDIYQPPPEPLKQGALN